MFWLIRNLLAYLGIRQRVVLRDDTDERWDGVILRETRDRLLVRTWARLGVLYGLYVAGWVPKAPSHVVSYDGWTLEVHPVLAAWAGRAARTAVIVGGILAVATLVSDLSALYQRGEAYGRTTAASPLTSKTLPDGKYRVDRHFGDSLVLLVELGPHGDFPVVAQSLGTNLVEGDRFTWFKGRAYR